MKGVQLVCVPTGVVNVGSPSTPGPTTNNEFVGLLTVNLNTDRDVATEQNRLSGGSKKVSLHTFKEERT